MDPKKAFIVSLFLFFLTFFGVALYPEEWYRISEPELQRLEKISQNWQTDKQSWLSQVQSLMTASAVLKKNSETLSAQLLTSRQTEQLLRKSFEKSETDRLNQAAKDQAKIDDLETQNNDLLKQKAAIVKQRNIIFGIMLVILVIIAAGLVLRVRNLFPFSLFGK